MFDLREHKGLIRRLVSEANQNDPNWKWSIKAINKTEAVSITSARKKAREITEGCVYGSLELLGVEKEG